MTDWYGGHDPVAQLKAGNDLLEPGTYAQTQVILAGPKSGQLTPAQLDRNVTRVLELVLRSPTFKSYKYSSQPALKANAAVARQAAAESLVLLRNEAGTYPVRAGASSLDIRQSATFTVPKLVVVQNSRKLLAPRQTVKKLSVKQHGFECRKKFIPTEKASRYYREAFSVGGA